MNILRKYIDIINENNNEELLDIINLIKTKCSDFISQMTTPNDFLIRGVKTRNNYEFFDYNRKNSYSNPTATNYLNELMANDGFIATRQNSLFAFPCVFMSDATGFGNVHYIFPQGSNWSLTWHSTNRLPYDLGDNQWYLKGLKELSPQDKKEYIDLTFDKESNPNRLNELIKKITSLFWEKYKSDFHQGKYLHKAIENKSEILLHGEGQAIGISNEYLYKNNLSNEFFYMLKAQ